ncbi:MAG: sugar ABC transporter substrate-binding protein [Gammaproteobacteria bacterium]
MKNKSPVILPFVGVTLLSLSLLAASGSDNRAAAADKKLRIGLVLPDLSNLYIAGLRNGVQAQAEKGGHEVLVKGTSDAAGQANATMAYIAAKVDALIMDPIDGKGIIPAIEAANKANIPVITIQSDAFGGERAAFIAGREDLAGLYMGMAASDWCLGINPCKIGIIEGIKADQSGAEEDKAFKEHVQKFPNIQIVGGSETQYDPAKALNLATNLLTANPDLNFLYAWWDPGGNAAVKAIQAKDKLGKVGVASQNGDCIALGHVINGRQTQTTAFFPDVIGAIAVTTAEDLLSGKKVTKFVEAPVLSVDTTRAKAWLAGLTEPPALVRESIMKRLKEAESGNCPVK